MGTFALPKEMEHWSLTTLREKLVKISAKIVRHGRYVIFQWPSGRGKRTIRPSVGCGENSVPLTVVRGYDLCKPGGDLGNDG
ncbi:MAG: hypothetical protein IIB62_07475 [Proteobacteria bacterium]|nr:hypothetical protein [Pseudomonadota bacterium]